jgi:hypothetical protein
LKNGIFTALEIEGFRKIAFEVTFI